MFWNKVYVKEFVKPLKDNKSVQNMKIYHEDILLEDIIKEMDKGENILLQSKDGQAYFTVNTKELIQKLYFLYNEKSAFYEALLSSINDAVTGVNNNNEIVTWNQVSERFYGHSLSDVFHKPITDFFKEEALILKRTIKNKESIENKYNQPAPNVHVLINANPVYLNGEVIGGISVERDISDLVKLNEELSNTKAYIYDLENKYEKGNLNEPFEKIKGKSKAINDAISIAKRVAKTDATVLITGESGVGKELFAEAIHNASHRFNKPFVGINCGAIPASLFESELFGYEKGTFTGANKEGKKGKIDLAQGGTLFLDEVGELPLDLQVKLLRVLQNKSFYRLGGDVPISIDVRIITATNRNLEKMVEEGKFREDLYYRLNVISLNVPPLRERQGDIPEILSLFLKEFSLKYGTSMPKISTEAMSVLLQDEWKGNIRQLRNIAERLIILYGEVDVIQLIHLSPIFKNRNTLSKKEEIEDIHVEKDEEEKIKQALKITYNNKSAAAKLLGMSRATLYNKMIKYGLIPR